MLRKFAVVPVLLLFAGLAYSQCTVSFTSAAVAEPTQNTIDSPGAVANPLSFTQNPQGADCGSWTVAADSAWIGFPNGTSGTAAQISYTVAANTGGPRTATITVNWPNAGGGPQTATYTVNQLGVVPATNPLSVMYRVDLAYGSAGCSSQTPQPFSCVTGSAPYVLNLPAGTYSFQATFHIANAANSDVAPLQPFVFVGTQEGSQSWQEIQSGSNVQIDVSPGTPLDLYLINNIGSSIPDPNNYADISISGTGVTCSNPFGPTSVGTPFTTTCTAAGDVPPWNFSTVFAAPVDGLAPTVNPQVSAIIAGTPTNLAVGDYSFYVSATDSTLSEGGPNTSVAPFSGTLPPPGAGLQIGCTPNYGPTNPGFQYSAVCTATGGTAQFNWSIVGALPAGLSLTPNGNSATIAGSPTDPSFGTQNISYVVQVQDATTATAQYTFTTQFSGPSEGSNILIGCSPGIGPLEVGVPVTQRCSAFNSVAPYFWQLGLSLTPPSGLTLTTISDTDAIVSGVPDATNVNVGFSYNLQVFDSDDDSSNSISFSGTSGSIAPQVTISCANAGGNLILGAPYTNTCTGANGVPAANAPQYTYWISAGALPAGLALSSTTGAISGAPTVIGAYSFTMQVYDSVHGVAATAFTVAGNIAPPLVITCASANGPQEVGIAYTNTCNVTGGYPPYSIFIGNSASPPPGVTFTTAPPSLPTAAIIAGTPTTAAGGQPYNYVVQVFDNIDEGVSQTFSGTVARALTASCTNTAAPIRVGLQYATTCTAANGISPFTWTVTDLPPGLTTTPSTSPITGATLTISGTPTQAGAVAYSATVTDAVTAAVQEAWQGNINPPPIITSVNPTSAVAGALALTLTVNGTGFATGAVVHFGQTALTTTFVSATQLTAAVPATLLTTAAVNQITVLLGGVTSNAAQFTVNPPPIITSVNPTSAVAGALALTLTVNGTGFATGAVVHFGQTALTTTFVSATQLTAAVPATLLTTAAVNQITVLLGGVTSNAAQFTVNPPPIITSVNPTSAVAGALALTLTVNGTGFATGAVVHFGQTALTTTFVSATQLTAAVPATLLTTAAVNQITVLLGGVTSNAAQFTVNPPPIITSVNPTSAVAGALALTLTVNGTGFATGAVVHFGQTALTTTFVSATQLTGAVPATLLTTAAVNQITVLLGEVTSNAAQFTVNPPLVITSVNPVSAIAGGPALTLTVSGTGFPAGAVVQFGQTPLTTTVVSATQLTANVPATLLATAGVNNVTVSQGNLTSNALPFAVNPAPVITSINPVSAVAGSPDLALTVTGTGFANGAVVQFGQTPLATSTGQVVDAAGGLPTAYNPTTNRLIRPFGSSDTGMTFSSDVWILTNANGQGGTPAWSKLTVSGAAPAGRNNSVVAYDQARNQLILFGGCASSCQTQFNDVWMLTNADGTGGSAQWTQLNPSGTLPAPRSYAAGAYDPVSDGLIVFGGGDFSGGHVYNDSWILTNVNGTGGAPQWLQLSPSGTLPSPRQALAGVYDPNSNRFIIFGGTGGSFGGTGSSDAANQTWVLTNANGVGDSPAWIQLAPANSPSRSDIGGVYDASNNRLMFCCGADPVAGQQNDAWVLSNANGLGGSPGWAQLSVTGTPPQQREDYGAAYDPTTKSMIVHGGSYLADTWILSNANGIAGPSAWTPITPTSELSATIPATLLATAGPSDITVLLGGVTSNAIPFAVNAAPAAPVITGINPTSAIAGAPALTLTVTGTGFAAGAVVKWGSTPLTTTVASATQLSAAVPATLLTTAGVNPITVLLGGVTSNAVQFVVGAAPVITSLSPSSATVGSGAQTLIISGSGFDSSSVVFFGSGTSLTPTAITATQLTVQVPASALATAASIQVFVLTGGISSNMSTFTVTSTPVITSLSPASAANGSPAFTLTVNGAGYASNAVVQWNSTALTTTFVSASQLTAAVPATLLTTPDVAKVTVLSGGVTSAPISFSVTATAAIVGLATTITPAQPSTVGVSIANPASVDLNGSLQLSFTPGVDGLPVSYADPTLQFTCTGATCNTGHTALDFTIPAGQTSVSPLPGGTIMPGTVAGTITVTLATLTRSDTQANVAPATPVTATIQVPKLMPVTTAGSVQITGLSSSGFNVELNGFSNTRELSSITVTFMPAPGTLLKGTTSFTIPVSSAFAAWFNSTEGQNNGSTFGLTIPFTLSGDTKVINSVTVTLTNSIGTSTPETGTVAQ